MKNFVKKLSVPLFAFILLLSLSCALMAKNTYITQKTQETAVDSIAIKHGTASKPKALKGVMQAANFWLESDGTQQEFIDFCTNYFLPSDDMATFNKIEENFNTINGHMHEIDRKINEPLQLDLAPVLPIDKLFGELAISSHLTDDYFKTKIAFVILLNYPKISLAEKNAGADKWSRVEWAKMRLADRFSSRIPANVIQAISKKYLDADDYISHYNIYMNNLLTEDGKRVFPEGLMLISHWGLRDELRGLYKDANGLEKQKMIQKVMERIIAQEIPKEVINSKEFDWAPFSNKLFKNGKEVKANPENGTRYGHLKNIFKAAQLADPYFQSSENTLILRHFNNELEISEKDVEDLLMSIISSPIIKDCGKLIEKRLGRKAQPFDIWYTGFESKSQIPEKELDRIVSQKYPDVKAFQKDIPNILMKLGFDKERAEFLGSKIVVDPSRSAGHASGAEGKEFNAHLRTRAEKGKMNYKSYNIACHELGHCVEQVTSISLIDHTLINGVPNIAFTEAFAFLFQSRDLELLGIKDDKSVKKDEMAVETVWKVYEIGGVSLVAMKAWRWMYAHPDATDAELQQAVTEIAGNIWNKYYEPVLGEKDCTLLAIYSHMIDTDLYLPNYPIGHIIRYQIEDYIKDKSLAKEMSRMCLLGNITPDAWMKQAVGQKISTAPILKNAKTVLDKELSNK